MRALLICALAAACAALLAGSATGAGLRTALIDHDELDGPDAALALQRARAAGGTAFRVMLEWYKVAPAERPAGFDASNQADPAYSWAAFDRQIQLIAAAGLDPIVVIHYPPVWAGGGYRPSPDPVEFAKFAGAAATRYNGANGLPRVRNWMLWNEPNLDLWFSPQYVDNQLVSPDRYRQLLNAGADAVHAVHADNNVIAGALSPFEFWDAGRDLRTSAPMEFMRRLLCMSNARPPQPTCAERTHFDTWAHHPYTKGGPTHQADSANDASLGDLPEMRTVLDGAARAGHVVSRSAPRFWVTEFSWDTNPPDPKGVPLRLHARWTAEAMQQMWKVGIDLVAWLELRDFPYPANPVQAGLWYRGGPRLACDEAKTPLLNTFRFPFTAYRQKRKVSVWGRTPTGRGGKIVIERITRKGWKKLGTLRADGTGIFKGRVKYQAAKGRFTEVVPAPHEYYRAVLCDDPRSYWRLGEPSGTQARDEAGARPGVYDPGVRFGVPGALQVDSNRAVQLGGTSKVDVGWQFSPRTVEFWVRTTQGQTAAVFSNRNDISHHVYVGLSDDGRVLAFDTRPLRSQAAVNDGRWHYVVYTHDGATGRLYVDGAESASATYERILGGAEASIGFDRSVGTWFRGDVDDVAIYNAALTTAQIRDHYAARMPRKGSTAGFRGQFVRARMGRVSSQPFSLVRVGDRPALPFG